MPGRQVMDTRDDIDGELLLSHGRNMQQETTHAKYTL